MAELHDPTFCCKPSLTSVPCTQASLPEPVLGTNLQAMPAPSFWPGESAECCSVMAGAEAQAWEAA